MIKIATPVSTLFDSHRILVPEIVALSDALELRDHSHPVQSDLPRLFHCEASLVEPWDEGEAARIARIILDNNVKLASFHLNSCFVKPPVKDGIFQPVGRKMSGEEMVRNARQNIAALRVKLAKSVGVAVENNNYYPTEAYEIVTDAAFISSLAKELGLKILLDLSHVRVTVGNGGARAEDYYLTELDLDNVVQIHLSRPRRDDAIFRDAHDALEDEDWAWAAEVIQRCPNLQYATVEYYKDADKLVSMLKKLREVLA